MPKAEPRFLTVDEAVQMAAFLGGAVTAIGQASVSLASNKSQEALEHNRLAGTELEKLVKLLKRMTAAEKTVVGKKEEGGE